jgi:hypothetical protein
MVKLNVRRGEKIIIGKHDFRSFRLYIIMYKNPDSRPSDGL